MPNREKIKDIEAVFISGYQAGLNEGQKIAEERLSARIETVKEKCSANCLHLFDEVCRLDKLEPTTGIVLTYRETERLINILKKNKSYWWVGILRKKIKTAYPQIEEVMEVLGEKIL